jgi:hypothetical protein
MEGEVGHQGDGGDQRQPAGDVQQLAAALRGARRTRDGGGVGHRGSLLASDSIRLRIANRRRRREGRGAAISAVSLRFVALRCRGSRGSGAMQRIATVSDGVRGEKRALDRDAGDDIL